MRSTERSPRGGITVIHGTLDPASDPAGYARLRARGPTAVALGKFDGVHLGHRALLEQTIDEAHRQSLQAGAVTFDVHPAEILHGHTRQYLTTLDERLAQLAAAGLHFVLMLRGTAVFAMTAANFAERLVTELDCRAIVVGANFRFGRGAAGDIGTLRAVGAAHGARTIALDLLPALGGPVSASRIREEVSTGRLDRAAELLGRPFTIVGTLTRRDHERCMVAIPPKVVRPPAGRYDGWMHPCAGSGQARSAIVVVSDSDYVDAVLLPGPTPFDARAGDRVRIGFKARADEAG